MNAFVTGTDTGVGKTYVTARLIRHLRSQGLDTVGFKPICCGSRDDAELLQIASGRALTLNEVNPVWLRTPAAPYTAAIIENRLIDLSLIRETFAALRARFSSVLVEGVGGWLVPIAKDYTVASLALDCALPVVVVVKNRLGALNHAALTVAHIKSMGLTCAGLILNHGPETVESDPQTVATTTNQAVLEDWLNVPVIASLAHNQEHIILDAYVRHNVL